ncbi:hypothetical protein [Burkholderia stagnalis]
MAQSLATFLAAKAVGLKIEDIHITPERWTEAARINADLVQIDLPGAIQQLKRKEYIENRIFVLCAKAYAVLLLSIRDAERGEGKLTGNEFWDHLRENIEDSLLRELCALYLIEDDRSDLGDNFEANFEYKSNQYIATFGLKPLSKLLTKKEFLSLLSSLMNEPAWMAADLHQFDILINDEAVADYKAGEVTVQFSDEKSHEFHGLKGLSSSTKGMNSKSIAQRCLAAHELGHWLAAMIVGIETSGIHLQLEDGGGNCTVFLGQPAFKWELVSYLKSRIAVLCAGSLADCCTKYPLQRHAIGNEFYLTLYRRTGIDDFSKLREIFLIYRTMSHRTVPAIDLSRPPSRDELLGEMVSLLREFGIWNILISDEYQYFVERILSSEMIAESIQRPRDCDGNGIKISTATIETYIPDSWRTMIGGTASKI